MYIFKIAYDGRYSFQAQPHKDTVCDKITEFLIECGYLDEDKMPITYGGRTDHGVSALGNFVIYNMDKKPVLSRLNSKLHKDGIWVLGYKEIDAIPDVEYRHYRYILPNIGQDPELMRNASKRLIGTHSFHNLSRRDKSKDRDPVRTVYDIKIESNEYFITVEIFGKSFLWNMVRKIVAVLSNIGLNKYEDSEKFIDELFDSAPKLGIRPAKAEGLILVDVKTNIDFEFDDYTNKRFAKYWRESAKASTMTMGLSKTMLSTNKE